MLWDMYKKAFYAWESTTAKYVEEWLKSPLVLGPSGAMLTAVMKTKVASGGAAATLWGTLGVPTERDEERTLHALNQIQSRLIDLEEKLADSKASNG